MMKEIKLDAIEGYEYYGSAGYWEGFAAGARAAADHAKDKLLRDIIGRRKPAAGPMAVPDNKEQEA